MKCIGLIGGMSWESSAQHYVIVNRAVRDRLGGSHSARSLMLSVDFAELEELAHAGEWDRLGDHLVEAAQALERGGADFLVLCTNTMHMFAERIETASSLPLLHIADPTGEAIREAGIRKIGLLGTAFTMEQDFYKARFAERFGIETIIPEEDDRREIHRVIFDELIVGRIEKASRQFYREAMARLAEAGAEGIVLGCTEIMLLVGEEDSPVPLFDTTTLHALAAVELALGN
jgi:aspartate racemase